MANLYDMMLASQGEVKANNMILLSLFKIFGEKSEDFDKSLTGSGLDMGEVRLFLAKEPDISKIMFGARSFSSTQYNWEVALSGIFKFARDNDIDLSKDESYGNWITNNAGRLTADLAAGKFTSYWSRPPEDYLATIEAAFLSGNVDPIEMWKERFPKNSPRRYNSVFDIELMKSIAKRIPDEILKAIEETDFHKNYPYSLRAMIYESIARTGKLSKKAARRIRSDPSEEAAITGIKTIGKNLGKYSNATEILSQVMDVTYGSVAVYLAKTIPEEYLMFMAVSQDQEVRKIIVERMTPKETPKQQVLSGKKESS